EKGLLSCDDFMPMAEDAGMGLELACLLWKTACMELRAMMAGEALRDTVRFIIPLPNGLFARSDLAQWLEKTANKYGIPAERILIALPESCFWLRGLDVDKKLDEIQARGFGFVLDNFASGYSSLEMLRTISYQGVKLNPKLVARLGLSQTDETVVDAAIYLAKNLGLEVMANGVETENQYRFLNARGCGWLQGAYVDKQLPC
ncbi:MAG: hypothetical protein CSA49_01635, partial [Gammaproteobacteria bacterium]